MVFAKVYGFHKGTQRQQVQWWMLTDYNGFLVCDIQVTKCTLFLIIRGGEGKLG